MHVGQYSEGEFVAPSGVMGNMTTLHEIPDDIFDTLGMITSTQNKLFPFRDIPVNILRSY